MEGGKTESQIVKEICGSTAEKRLEEWQWMEREEWQLGIVK
jgi:hypothetical protein